MKQFYLPILAFTFMFTGCNHKLPKQSAGVLKENMDTTALPGTDFYQYACGGWMKNHPLTDEYSRFGSFDELGENNRKQLKILIEDLAVKKHEKNSIAQKIGDLYNLAMDSARLNDEKETPIKIDLDKIAVITDKDEIPTLMGELNADLFFSVYVDADPMDSKKNLLQTHQSGLGMGERDYYLDTDKKMKEIRNKYQEHIEKMFLFAGFSETEAKQAVKNVMEVETQLAQAHFTKEKLRDPYGNYHKMSTDSLKKEFTGFDWDKFLKAINSNVSELSVSQPEPIKAAIKIINTTSLEKLKQYMQWSLINASASFLSDEISKQNFDFYGRTMSGKQEQQPRWKRAVSTVDGSLGEAVGQMYVEKYFPAIAKERMENLVQNLLKTYGERIDKLEWMSDSTKAMAHEKLSTFYVKVGYPNKWRDYTKLEIDPEQSYWENVKRVSKFNHDIMMAKTTQTVDKDEWYMTPQTVNAYYNPTTNEICFPAGILQYPFFDMNADDAFNYGAIGVVIAHEVTHGFDDQGSQFDKFGNLSNWWTSEDKTNFEARTKVMENFFNKIEVSPGVFANGAFTLGENIADHGGLQVSFQAFKNITQNSPLENKEGFTPEQRFFLAYANVWAGNIRPEEILRRTKTDPHSLGKWRVNGALPHIEGWYEAFGITPNDPLYVAPENRVSIW